MFEGAGVGGDADVGQGGRRQHGATGVGGHASDAQAVGGVAFPPALGMDAAQVFAAPGDEVLVGGEQGPAGGDVFLAESGMAVQFLRHVKAAAVDDLVAGGLLGVGGEAVVLQAVACYAGDVLDREVDHGVLGHGGVAVAQHPAFVEVGGLFLADLSGDLIEGFGPAGGHGEGDSYLLLRQQSRVEGVDAAGKEGFPALARFCIVGEIGHELRRRLYWHR